MGGFYNTLHLAVNSAVCSLTIGGLAASSPETSPAALAGKPMVSVLYFVVITIRSAKSVARCRSLDAPVVICQTQFR